MSWPRPATFWLRSVAIGIAILAAVDPTVTTARHARLTVALAVEDPVQDAPLVERVRQVVGKDITVIPAPFSPAQVTLFIGRRPAVPEAELTDPIVAINSGEGSPRLEWFDADIPATAPLTRSVQIVGTLHAIGASGKVALVTLQVDGVAVASQKVSPSSNDTLLPVLMRYVPTATGLARLRLTAQLELANDSAVVDATIEVLDRKWSVLVFEPRPSWMATFVRRALQDDPAFVVDSRVVTSTNIAASFGTPPNSLNNLMSMGSYDVVLIGAPEELTPTEVAGLNTLLRRRGAQVVLLMDRVADGPIDRLIGSPQWQQDSTRQQTLHEISDDSVTLRASHIAWPRALPPAAEIVAQSVAQKGDTTPHPVIWRSPVGAGSILVSGALDSWSFRESEQSSFNAFWRSAVASAAMAAPHPVTLSLTPALPRPGERVTLRVTLRDPALQLTGTGSQDLVRSTVAASLEKATISGATGPVATPVPLWPSGVPGELIGEFTTNATDGRWLVRVSSDFGRADVPFMVAADAHRLGNGNSDLLQQWAITHGGSVLQPADILTLPEKLREASRTSKESTPWHPMRSIWWLLPFVLSLSAEWWLRRRRGLL